MSVSHFAVKVACYDETRYSLQHTSVWSTVSCNGVATSQPRMQGCIAACLHVNTVLHEPRGSNRSRRYSECFFFCWRRYHFHKNSYDTLLTAVRRRFRQQHSPVSRERGSLSVAVHLSVLSICMSVAQYCLHRVVTFSLLSARCRKFCSQMAQKIRTKMQTCINSIGP